jgi:hypothetical protein
LPPFSTQSVGSVLLLLEERLHFLDAERRHSAMKYRMAVRAHRPQIRHWIDRMGFANLGQRAEVMNVDVPLDYLPVCGTEAESADMATRAVGSDAITTGPRVAFVSVDDHAPGRAFDTQRRFGYFLREE